MDISGGGISDSIPEWFWNISSSMAYVNISHNKIHRALPTLIPKFKNSSDNPYYIWDLSFNNLSSSLPKFLPQAYALLLSNNMLSGSMSSLCATLQSRLRYLDLSNNLLAGALPDCWEQFQSLQVLNLENNSFSGKIPNSIVTLKEIEIIHLNNNNLSGEMPSFMHSPKLQFIDVGRNNLNGILPMLSRHNLPNLIGLLLQENKFQGGIPTSLCDMLHLQILDFSQNNIGGTIPHCLNNLIALSNLTISRKTISYTTNNQIAFVKSVTSIFIDKARLTWKGRAVEYEKNPGLMTMIDFSCNHLNGEVPNNITTLVALASLNLSRNNLTGFIPSNMGQMNMLESLDLSRNSLSGRIPDSFSALSFLSFLNLSFNNLSGEIPQTTQLQTFNASSYEGNPGLYGPPLTPGCPGDGSNRTHTNDAEEDEDSELISFGFYVSMIFGFVIGFWGACGTLIVKSPWRRAYFQSFSNMNDWIYVQVVHFWARMKRRFQG